MPPAQPAPAPTNPAPAPAPAPATPTAPVADPSQPVPFEFGTPGETPPAPAPTPPADEVPAWAKQFMQSQEERWTNLESALAAEPTPPEPGAPIGAPAQPTQSELAARNPQSWADVENFVNEKIQQGVQNGIEGFTKQSQDAAAEAERQKEQTNREFDALENTLQTEGYLPAVANPNDRNDPGRVARRELYGMAAKLGTTDLRAVAQNVLTPLHQAGQMYDPITDSNIAYQTAQPGANSPIGSSSATTGFQTNTPSYKDIRNARSFDELRARAGF